MSVSRNEFHKQSTDSSGGSMMFLKHTDVRMARTKVRGSLNLVYNLCEMNGWETQSDFSINPRQSLEPFCLPLPVDVPLSSRHVEIVHTGP